MEEKTSEKIFNPVRFDETNFLAKRRFLKLVNKKSRKRELMYAGEARVVVSKYTPIQCEYSYKNNYLRVNFYIQRYTRDNFVVDTSLQKLMNTNLEVNENIFDED